jgi:hypothetical protein
VSHFPAKKNSARASKPRSAAVVSTPETARFPAKSGHPVSTEGQGVRPPSAVARRHFGLTDVASLIGGGASSGLFVASIVPAVPMAAATAAALGSLVAFLIGRRMEAGKHHK